MLGQELQVAPSWPEIDAAIAQLIASRKAMNTQAAYKADWFKWRVFVASTGVDLRIPGLAATVTFRDQLIRDYSTSSVARILSSLSFFYAALRDAGLVRTNPFARAWLPRPEASELRKTQAIGEDVVQSLERVIAQDRSTRGRRDAAMVRILYDTGLRRASLAGLRRDQLHRDAHGMIMTVIVKGGKERAVKLTAEAEAALNAWLAVVRPSLYVFPKKGAPTGHISLALVNKVLKDRAREAGLTISAHPHRFRAAFITTAYDAKIYERDIQTAVHHANASTTRGYDRGARGDDVFDRVSEFRKNQK